MNHPDDELLAALAGADPDATGDPSLLAHVDACDRCAPLVEELRAVRTALAELPDLQPMRPLRLLPPVDEPAPGIAERLAGVVRRAFAPALTAGVALVLVGTVGTVAPNMASSGGASVLFNDGDEAAAPDTDEGAAEEFGAMSDGAEATAAEGAAAGEAEPDSPRDSRTNATDAPNVAAGSAEAFPADPSPSGERAAASATPADFRTQLPAERSPWPMVLFSGVALIAGTLLLRWILVPRAS